MIRDIRRSARWLSGLKQRLWHGSAPAPAIHWTFTAHAWAIGIYDGRSPTALEPARGVTNPVLTAADVTDMPARFVADPFMLQVDGRWHMFFEAVRRGGHGEIGWATSHDGREWTYQGIVLAEPFHLSYPYVFRWQDEYYMVPESHQTASVRLYQGIRFPEEWRCVATLLDGHPRFADSSLFRHEQTWWMFTETNPELKCNTLRLYHAANLRGPWTEHPQSPIIVGNPHIARPAGRVIVLPDRLIRYTQDCFPVYGTQVRAYEIVELSRTRYREHPCEPRPLLGGSGIGWNACGMHHIDAHQVELHAWLACVDGWTVDP